MLTKFIVVVLVILVMPVPPLEAAETNAAPMRTVTPNRERWDPAASAADHKRMMDLLRIPAPGPFPPAAEDPNRPPNTHPVGNGSPNWSDDVAGEPPKGHTIVRSAWGNWSNYDLKKADRYPLPNPLLLKNGGQVADAQTWWSQKRPEILGDFFTEIYGKIPPQTPKVKWEATDVNTNAENGSAVTKTLVGRVDNSSDPAITVNIEMTLAIPSHATQPVPVIIVVGGRGFGGFPTIRPGPSAKSQVLAKGWAYATFNPSSVQADNGGGLTRGIIGLVNHGQPRQPDDWGALSAWAWGLSRCLDYLETDPAVNARKVGLEGHSRYGKEALVAMAFDSRFAIAYSSCSGEGGAKLHRHDVGESVDNVAGDGEYHWMAGNFLKYAGHWNALPVDAHELIGLCAPRPVFITGGSTDLWSDPVGEFKACVGAGPIYRLLDKRDVGATEMPEPDTALISGDIGYREHLGGHTDAPDWPVFLKFASKYF